MSLRDSATWTPEFWQAYRDDLLAFFKGDERLQRTHFILEPDGTTRPAADLLEWQRLVLGSMRADGTFGCPRIGLDEFPDSRIETLFTGRDSDALRAGPDFTPRCFVTAITEGVLNGYEARTATYDGAARLHAGLAEILENGDGEALREQQVLLDSAVRRFVLASGPRPEDSWERIRAEVVPLLQQTDFTLLHMITLLEHELPPSVSECLTCSGTADECRDCIRTYLAGIEWEEPA